jgi:hypothetical protein
MRDRAKVEVAAEVLLETQLQADGYKVRQIKVEAGCYEVYATDKDGKRANMAYNAETLEKLSNAEAGENSALGQLVMIRVWDFFVRAFH